jgi:predicted RNase H-like nuclease (RuvC/YqgF family)
MSNRPSDDIDDGDNTDELPVLLETAVLADARDEPLVRSDDTSEQTVLYRSADGIADLEAKLAEGATRVATLEAQIVTLTDRGRELEQRLVEKDRLIDELEHHAAALRAGASDTTASERQLAAQLATRDARIAELTAKVERLEAEAAARTSETDRLRAAVETTRREADVLKTELATRPPANGSPPDVEELLEEKATLAAYIATRRSWWDEAQAKQTELGEKVAGLQNELAVSGKRLRETEAFAARESDRAVALRAELVDYARRVAALEREQRSARAIDAVPAASGVAGPSPAQVPTSSAAASPSAAAAPPASAPPRETPTPTNQPTALEPIDTGLAVEAVAQLEAEVEYKRQQVAAQLVELHDRDQRLRAGASELERVRREIATLRGELDESRAATARLERAVIDKDRALEARDARVATLQDEIKQRAGALEELNAIDVARRDPPPIGRPASADASSDNVVAPALLCLTGDAPKRIALTKKTLTIGRGPHCDLQILTHFVSREHARITLNAGRALIEDAGSRNGVFVNSVRVDSQVLQQGDLITIGDSQFRFVESMAH